MCVLASGDTGWSFWPDRTTEGNVIASSHEDWVARSEVESSSFSSPQSSPRLLQDDYRSSISESELNKCVRSLQDVSVNNRVDRQNYVTFLEQYSGRSLVFSTFDDLPLSLVLIFYTAACSAGGIGSGGGRCGSIDPKIKLNQLMPGGGANPTDGNSPLLIVFCTTIKDVEAIQIEFLFQYLLRYENGMTTQQVLVGANGDTVKDDLERATELVLLDSFGCDLQSTQRRMRESIVSSELQRRSNESIPWNMTSILVESSKHAADGAAMLKQESSFDQILQGLRRQRLENVATELESAKSQRVLQSVGLPRCDYRVSARIRDFVQIGEIMCAMKAEAFSRRQQLCQNDFLVHVSLYFDHFL